MIFKQLVQALILTVGLVAVAAAASKYEDAETTHKIVLAWEWALPLPVLTVNTAIEGSQHAYRLQRQAIEYFLGEQQPTGFKAGLTTVAAQQRFSVSGPVAGVLLPGSELLTTPPIHMARSAWLRPMLEMELGFRLQIPEGRASLPDVAALRQSVIEVFPVLEFPDMSFDRVQSLTGLDIIATNVAARYWIRGSGVEPGAIDPNALEFKLSRDDAELQRSRSDAVAGDQWQALLWLVNHVLQQGWQVSSEQVFITGAAGPMLPLERGRYVASFGALGEITFTAR